MKLGIKNRILLNGLLPAEGNFATLKTIQELRTALYLTAEEVAEFEFVQETDQCRWNPTMEREVEITINKVADKLITDILTKLNAENKLTTELLGLYEKFLEPANEEIA